MTVTNMSLPQSQWDSSVFLFFKENCEIRIRRRVMTCCIRSNAQTVNKKPVNKKPSKLSSKSLGGRRSSSVVAFRRGSRQKRGADAPYKVVRTWHVKRISL